MFLCDTSSQLVEMTLNFGEIDMNEALKFCGVGTVMISVSCLLFNHFDGDCKTLSLKKITATGKNTEC